MTNKYTELIHTLVHQHTNKTEALKMKTYMRNKFEFAGIRAPQRKTLVKDLIKQHGPPPEKYLNAIIQTLWKCPEREYQYIALELLDRKLKRFKTQDIELLEHLITNKSWWDTVDWIASKHVGDYFKHYPASKEELTSKWIESNNIWLQRSAILFQLKYKTSTDEELLYNYINQCLHSDEFFINKAVGWALREYSKTNPESVLDFVQKTSLSNLSKSEALKIINKSS